MIGIQTNPKKDSDGTVLIVLSKGNVLEVVSDLQLDVKVTEVESGNSYSGSYKSFPSRPLWEFLQKAIIKLENLDEKSKDLDD
jgi:hypothetical protein